MFLLGIDLERTTSRWNTFRYQQSPVAHEDHSFWGVLGFALIWPTVMLFLFGIPTSREGRILALAAVLFMVMQSYGIAYEPWHGRRTIIAAGLAVPLVGWCWGWKDKKYLRYYLVVVVGVGCLSGLCAVLFRNNGSMIPLFQESVFSMNRLQQLTRNKPQYYEPLRKFEVLVPPQTTTAVCLRNYRFEYPLFGERLTRKLIPLHSFWRGKQPVPGNADYLLYSEGYFDRKDGDVQLDKDWFLRKLTRDVAEVR
jgi:hypothetical protein